MCGYGGHGQLAGVKLRFGNKLSYPLSHLRGPCTSALLFNVLSTEDISYKGGAVGSTQNAVPIPSFRCIVVLAASKEPVQ